MKLLRKLAALLAAGALAISALTVVASATNALDLISTKLTSGKAVSDTLGGTDDLKKYSIKVNNPGELNININIEAESTLIVVMDSETNVLIPKCVTHKTGSDMILAQGAFGGLWDNDKKILNTTATYDVKKGTYYIAVNRAEGYTAGSGKYTLTATAPQPKIDYLSLTLPKGSKVVLGTILSADTSASIKWNSSKKTVATVTDKGVLNCLKAGTTVVTAKLGTSIAKIKIIVK